MKVLFDNSAIDFPQKTAISVGMFDGIHKGHQVIIKKLHLLKQQHDLLIGIVTFDPHPRQFFSDQPFPLLTPLQEKIDLLRSYNVDFVRVITFNEKLAQTDPEYFYCHYLIESLNLHTVILGKDHRFGKDRTGDITTVKNLGHTFGFDLLVQELAEDDNQNISSSLIKQGLLEGNISKVNNLLSYRYTLQGQVIRGKQYGRSLGFPTANIALEDSHKLIPKTGIYIVKVSLKELDYFGLISIGYNPTIAEGNNLSLEVYIFNFNQDIYDQHIKVEFLDYIRPEQKFKSLDELVKQMKKDEVFGREYLKKLFKT